jgi:hypothetical protein
MPERKVFRDYGEPEVRDLLTQTDMSSWQDLVHFLQQREGESGNGALGETAHLMADAKQAMKDNVPFARSPEQAYRVLKSHRNPELVRQEEQKWLARSQPVGKVAHAGKRSTA